MNRFRKNKKGLDYAVLLALIIVPLALFFLFSKVNGILGEERQIGFIQTNMLNSAQEAENILFYIDQSAKNSAGPSLFKLANNGGFYSPSNCGNYNNYPIWQTKDKECYPDIYSNFNSFFIEEFDDYLANYSKKNLKNSYFLTIRQDKIIGQPVKDISLDISDKERTNAGTYLFTPSFSENIDLKDFEDASKYSRQIFEKCVNANKTEECIDAEIINNKLIDKWSFNFKDNTSVFDIATDKKLWIYENKQLKRENMAIKFALQFS